jgi:hypothetical protein
MRDRKSAPDWPLPWPIDTLVNRLQEGSVLYNLTQHRRAVRGHDVRENALEELVQDVMQRQFGSKRVTAGKQIGTTLKLQNRPFPAKTRPDVTVDHLGKVHICELKSNRIEYGRFDNVFDSRPFQNYLRSVGDAGKVPWEVEQDLIKLHQFKSLSPRVGSCIFIMLDAFEGSGRSWTQVFASKRAFLDTMRSDLVKGWADKLLGATRIVPLEARNASARLITCVVHSWKP